MIQIVVVPCAFHHQSTSNQSQTASPDPATVAEKNRYVVDDLNLLAADGAENEANLDYYDYDDYEDYDDGVDDDDFVDYDLASDSYKKSGFTPANSQSANSQSANSQQQRNASFQPSDKQFRRYTNRVSVEHYEGPQLPANTVNTLLTSNRRSEQDRLRSKDKRDRATAEQVDYW